jgi:hypothetical protein
MNTYGVILFHTTAAVMSAEKLLAGEGISVKLTPPPRECSSDCGIAMQIKWAECDRIKGILDFAGIEIDSIHSL